MIQFFLTQNSLNVFTSKETASLFYLEEEMSSKTFFDGVFILETLPMQASIEFKTSFSKKISSNIPIPVRNDSNIENIKLTENILEKEAERDSVR